jgi:hypothetical protein
VCNNGMALSALLCAVRMYGKTEAPSYWDVHWTPQVTLLRPDLIAYTKLVKMESANELSTGLAERFGSQFVDPFATRSETKA